VAGFWTGWLARLVAPLRGGEDVTEDCATGADGPAPHDYDVDRSRRGLRTVANHLMYGPGVLAEVLRL
jgi:hypothetical protein